MRAAIAWGLVCAAAVACSPGGEGHPPETASALAGVAPAPLVSIVLRGAVVGPTKVDGRSWDGIALSAPTARAAEAWLARELDAPFAAAVVVGDWAASVTDKPEPYGEAEVESEGRVSRRALPKNENTFEPRWMERWDHVVLAPGARFRVTLADKDIEFDDPIGTAVVEERELLEVMRAGEERFVRVADQTRNQLLFVDLAVVPEDAR